jgi:hypothetical protein
MITRMDSGVQPALQPLVPELPASKTYYSYHSLHPGVLVRFVSSCKFRNAIIRFHLLVRNAA